MGQLIARNIDTAAHYKPVCDLATEYKGADRAERFFELADCMERRFGTFFPHCFF